MRGGVSSERWLVMLMRVWRRRRRRSLAALEELGQGVPQLRQLEDLAVQQLEQRAQALVKGVPLLLAALQALLQLPQLGLQRLVPGLRVLQHRPGHGAGGGSRRTRFPHLQFERERVFLSLELVGTLHFRFESLQFLRGGGGQTVSIWTRRRLPPSPPSLPPPWPSEPPPALLSFG